MIDKNEEQFIRHLVQSPQWTIIANMAKRIVDRIKEENTIRDNEWETIRATLTKEGKVEGIKELLQEMFVIGSK